MSTQPHPFEPSLPYSDRLERLLSQALARRDARAKNALPLLTEEAVQSLHREVRVGQRVAPSHTKVAAFLARWTSFYGGAGRGEADAASLQA